MDFRAKTIIRNKQGHFVILEQEVIKALQI